jgi:NDP-sugar pyrophosphorylase family protein
VSYRVVIPTAGIGSRLEKLTKYLNKSLVSVANKPILSHLIDQFPKTCDFVIALGYKGDLVKDFLQICYPERIFHFVNVDPYEGKGSGLGYSLLCCKKYLQEPFVFISCDTLVKESIPNPKFNWMGYASKKKTFSYRTLQIKENKIIQINEKNSSFVKNQSPYIGLAGIHDYKNFWEEMENGKPIAIQQGEVFGLRKILKRQTIQPLKFTWSDTGTLEGLSKTRKLYNNLNQFNILEKENEAIWFVGNKVVKFSTDHKFIKNRFIRSKKIKKFIPKVLYLKKNMYLYKKIEGKVLSKIITLSLFNNLLKTCKVFWKKRNLTAKEKIIFNKNCYKFYYDKTLERINLFYKKFNKKDGTESINGEAMPFLSNLLNYIDWKDLTNGSPGRLHGDFHFENILYCSKKKTFKFLDWRQDFAGNLEYGDIYYDLAKLLHGLIVSHEEIVKKRFSIEWKNNTILFKLDRKQILEKCEVRLNQWCTKNHFSLKKIRILTGLIYLNIAALHHHPYSLLLYAIGKSMLKKEVTNNI